MRPVADLHVHTTNSDGSLTLDDVPPAARRADLRAVAITDHDRLHPGLDAPVTVADGVTIVHGVELRVELDSGARIDLLGYAVDPTPALTGEIDRLQRDRITRGNAIIDNVEEELGIDLRLEAREGLGRPHIATAIADHPDAPYTYQEAFDHLIGDDGPCFVPRAVPGYERARELLAEACAIVALAHPLRYEDPAAALALAPDLDAVERWYPYDDDVDHAPVIRTIDEHGLLATGGSDAHGDRLGTAGVPTDAFDLVASRLPDPR